VLGQAVSFALLAAVSPTALIVLAVYLGSSSPRRTASYYVAGALVMTAVTCGVVFAIIKLSGLDLPRHHGPRYALRLGLGALALAAGAFIQLRPHPSSKPASGLMSRLVTEPTPRIAFAAGVVLFAPSLMLLAAVQVVATARANAALTTLALIIVVIITVVIVWLPMLAFLAVPDRTTRMLKLVSTWLHRYGRTVAVAALTVGGAALVIDGALGLTRLSLVAAGERPSHGSCHPRRRGHSGGATGIHRRA
jgi:hypothetical protein